MLAQLRQRLGHLVRLGADRLGQRLGPERIGAEEQQPLQGALQIIGHDGHALSLVTTASGARSDAISISANGSS